MTPLAQMVLNELTLPVKRRAFTDYAGLLTRMDELHCFECTEVMEAAAHIGKCLMQKASTNRILVNEDMAFLPAARTWIEWQPKSGNRTAIHLERVGGKARQTTIVAKGSIPFGMIDLCDDLKDDKINFQYQYCDLGGRIAPDRAAAHMWLTYGLLALINTPRIIGRRMHLPHAGLQRNLSRAFGGVGKFPLRAWTEILLDIAPPRDESDSEPHEARLTGQRALHFVRCHLRIRNGQVERVREHWRGDAALGIKQSRYKMVETHASQTP